jgi:hypothetical protein
MKEIIEEYQQTKDFENVVYRNGLNLLVVSKLSECKYELKYQGNHNETKIMISYVDKVNADNVIGYISNYYDVFEYESFEEDDKIYIVFSKNEMYSYVQEHKRLTNNYCLDKDPSVFEGYPLVCYRLCMYNDTDIVIENVSNSEKHKFNMPNSDFSSYQLYDYAEGYLKGMSNSNLEVTRCFCLDGTMYLLCFDINNKFYSS